ncbi:mitochondrial carrier [Neoconidiobolus thromboides FSU 785]|nr:mitochondrial carrier [Neoconidiobolus thromboides FSU 785]
MDKQNLNYIVKSLLAGGVAGCAAKTLVAPLDRVKILFQVSNPKVQKHSGSFKGIFGAMSDIYKSHGTFGLFQGHSATILRVFPYASIKFMAFEQFKVIVYKFNYFEKSVSHFIAGSLAGTTSVIFTYPLDMIRTRMAYEFDHPLRIGETIRKIYNEPLTITTKNRYLLNCGGLINFYRGFLPTLLGIVPYAGVSFWAHSKLTTFFKTKLSTIAVDQTISNQDKVHLKAWAELTCGGLAGAIAQTCSYPLEVIRRRMQVAGIDSKFINRKGIFNTAQTILKEKGLRGFFVGLSIGYIKVTPMFAISFFTYSKMKQWLKID